MKWRMTEAERKKNKYSSCSDKIEEVSNLFKHRHYFFKNCTDKKYPDHPFDYLIQPQTRPQSQV